MPTGLMTSNDLVAVTGMKTSTKQVEWFRENFGIRVVRRNDGAPVITWETWEALNRKTYGISSVSSYSEPQRPALRPLRSVR
jgi:hypothetical protein